MHFSRGDAQRTAFVHTLTVPFDQKFLSLVLAAETSCDDKTRRALVKGTRKKTKLGERRGVRSNLRTYVSYAPGILLRVSIKKKKVSVAARQSVHPSERSPTLPSSSTLCVRQIENEQQSTVGEVS